tara:strand:+ start:2372 stop:2845 length:474 start_codon:yes stop_codon:yes gene_type:complete
MASFIFNKDQAKNQSTLERICQSDDDLQYYSSSDVSDIVTVSAEDFAKVKNNNCMIESHDGNNFTWFDHVTYDTSVPVSERDTKEILGVYLSHLVKAIDEWLVEFPSHAKTSEWQSYRDYCNNFDVDSISYPLDKTWEQYCADNSISYKNILELPTN